MEMESVQRSGGGGEREGHMAPLFRLEMLPYYPHTIPALINASKLEGPAAGRAPSTPENGGAKGAVAYPRICGVFFANDNCGYPAKLSGITPGTEPANVSGVP